MQKINDLFTIIDSCFGGSEWFVFLLLGTGLFFTLYLRFPQFRFFRHAIRVVRGKYDKTDDLGDTSHFQALATALSGTIGTGNIAGVALAIHLGGPSALFWMLVTAFFGMTTKMVEVTLSHKYRETAEDGSISGGPMYYMRNRLHLPWLAAIFAVATIFSSFGTGSLPQINSIATAMHSSFGLSQWICGALLSVILGMIVIGGIKRIAAVTEKLVPFMAVAYLLCALSILVYNYQNFIPSFLSIFSNVFSGTSATGGFLGATVAWAFNRGVNRGLFSNEAGQGSASIAHAAARAEEPVSEGMVALLEPFIDTIIVCMLTGLVIISSGVWNEKFPNTFQQADTMVLSGSFKEYEVNDKIRVAEGLAGKETLPLFTGDIEVKDGRIMNDDISILNARSFADSVAVHRGKELFSGQLKVVNGNIQTASKRNGTVYLTGKSLIHSAALSTEAFKRGVFGEWGQYVIPFALLLFAFSTAIAWSYYGDRAVTYLWGSKAVKYYHIIYLLGFFIASFTDTTLVWTISGVTVACMTLPNLIGLLLLHREVKSTIFGYWNRVKQGERNKS